MTATFESGARAAGLRKAVRGVLDLLLPPLCAICRKPVSEAHALCPACWSEIAFLDGPACARCGAPFEVDPGPGTLCAACHAEPPAFDRALSVLRYDDAGKKPILALKRADRHDLVPAFARWLERAGRELVAEADVLMPVPLHRRRLWQRRYNQAALLAHRISRLTSKPVDALALVRIKPTPSQGEMPSAKARRRNVRGAFKVARPQAVRGRNVLLVDDVLTTGATASACARALKRAGARSVNVLTVARVVRGANIAI
ncbi:MAG TPA: ComF family protein [Rhizomicrobium sp.]|nr:ComF family protein [Rhizomicrobium sp.]